LKQDNLRAALRARTSHQHERLDRAVGLFDTREQYAAFLLGSRRFRAATEDALDGKGGWQVEQLSDLIDADLSDLGRSPGASVRFPVVPSSEAFALGVAYVLEGSALGARLLARRAADLGFDSEHGARHLARQTGDKDRWNRFLGALDAVEPADREEVIAGAASAFDFALEAYAVAQR
jgi:heme oxygenase